MKKYPVNFLLLGLQHGRENLNFKLHGKIQEISEFLKEKLFWEKKNCDN